jgi:uncharacterized membrane protein (UPF0127 family)
MAARLARTGAAGFLVFAFLTHACALAAGTDTLVLKTETGEHRFSIEVARTAQEKALGLMFRRSMPADSGMLFLYGRSQPVAMWMKNTFISLDMVFIGADGRVHRIESHTEPLSTDLIASGGPVVAVLELNAGEADKIGLKPGDQVLYPGLGQPAAD